LDKFRVNVALPNLDSWYAAFDAKLYIDPSRRVRIW
jgi:predicted metalloendopeptidase